MSAVKYKMLVSDIDGTLCVGKPNSFPSDKVKNCISAAVDNGLIFTLASGRPFSMVKYLTEYLGNTGPCIVDNGAVIIDGKTGEVIWEALLSMDRARRILELLQGCEYFRVSYESGPVDNPKDIDISLKVRKVSVHDITPQKAEDLIQVVEREFKNVACIKAASYKGDHLSDIYFSDIGATKQRSVFELGKILGIEKEEIIGVGDGYNDFPLLMACGLKVAMGNAVGELKAIADFVAPTVDEDGLAYVLEKFYK